MKQFNYVALALLTLATVSVELAAKVVHIKSSAQLQSVINKNDNVVVKFFAPWCGPCKKFNPIYEKVSDKFGNDVVFASVDGDKHQDIMGTYKITSFPTVLYFQDHQKSGQGKERDVAGFEKEVRSRFGL